MSDLFIRIIGFVCYILFLIFFWIDNPSGIGSIFDFFLRPNPLVIEETMYPHMEILSQFQQDNFIYLIIGFVVVLTLVILIATFMNVGLIKGSLMADEVEGEGCPLSFSLILKNTKPYYWRVILLEFICGFAALFSLFLLIIFIFVFRMVICAAGIFLLIPLLFFIALLGELSVIALIKEDLGVFQAIDRAWQVIIHHLGHVVLSSLVLTIASMIVQSIFSFPTSALSMLLRSSILPTLEDPIVQIVAMAVFSLATLPVELFFIGLIFTFNQVFWTLVYRRLSSENGSMKIINSNPTAE